MDPDKGENWSTGWSPASNGNQLKFNSGGRYTSPDTYTKTITTNKATSLTISHGSTNADSWINGTKVLFKGNLIGTLQNGNTVTVPIPANSKGQIIQVSTAGLSIYGTPSGKSWIYVLR